jgi:hypothetical protein
MNVLRKPQVKTALKRAKRIWDILPNMKQELQRLLMKNLYKYLILQNYVSFILVDFCAYVTCFVVKTLLGLFL